MKFLYADNGRGLMSSLASSWLFWIVIVIVILLIVVLVLRSNKNLQKKLGVEKLFGGDGTNNNDSSGDKLMAANLIEKNGGGSHDDDDDDYASPRDGAQHRLIDEIGDENERYSAMDNGYVPDLSKSLDGTLDDDVDNVAQLLGVPSDENKHVKLFYHTSSKKENLFKIADPMLDAVNFKIELRDLVKTTYNPMLMSEVRIFNQDRKCIAIFNIEPKRLKIQSVSPFFDDVHLDLEESTRLLVFTQVSNRLYLDSRQIAAFNIYDKITYFSVKSPLVKEIQYSVTE